MRFRVVLKCGTSSENAIVLLQTISAFPNRIKASQVVPVKARVLVGKALAASQSTPALIVARARRRGLSRRVAVVGGPVISTELAKAWGPTVPVVITESLTRGTMLKRARVFVRSGEAVVGSVIVGAGPADRRL